MELKLHSPSSSKMDMKPSVVLYPYLGMGHIIPMVELAKLFIHHNFAVTIVLIQSPTTSPALDPFISRVTNLYPSISVHHLPAVTLPPTTEGAVASLECLRLSAGNLLQFLESLKTSSNIRALVLDMFCTSALAIAEQLQIPSYFFFASSAAALTSFMLLPSDQSHLVGCYKDLGDSPVHFPGLPPIPASELPGFLQERGRINELIMSHFELLPTANGIMVNTFESLEKSAVQALINGDVSVPGRIVPPIYCIGPVIGTDREEGEQKHECLVWLDEQPEKSVVFLCFGSMGAFTVEQLKEIATGLEKSGQRFLWVVRNPPTDIKNIYSPRTESDLIDLLPEGFLERTQGQGIVVKDWAPQAAVLEHKSIGAFVSHCGWNSILEAICAGVPIIGWPLYAEQKMNKYLMVEAKLAVGIDGYKKGLVSAEEVEEKIKWLMETEEGRDLRVRVTATAEEAVTARKRGGTSVVALDKLVTELMKDNS